MLVTCLLECGLLVLGGLLLMLGLPLIVRHAVNPLAALVLGHRYTACIGGVLHPVRQAIAAEAGEIHQVDVLHVGVLAQMLDQAAERGGLELGAGLVFKRHGASFRLNMRVSSWGAPCHKNSDGERRFPACLACPDRTKDDPTCGGAFGYFARDEGRPYAQRTRRGVACIAGVP